MSATVTGKRELTSLTIDPDAVDPEDVEMLQDMIMAAVNEALRAVDSAGASPERPIPLRVTGTVYAGDAPAVSVGPGEAVRIMTGAMLPAGCDCVLAQEDTDRGFPTVSIFRALRPHDNFCDRGEDFRAGTVLLPAGTRLDAAAVGVLASAGLCSVPVRRRPSPSGWRRCPWTRRWAAPWRRTSPPPWTSRPFTAPPWTGTPCGRWTAPGPRRSGPSPCG